MTADRHQRAEIFDRNLNFFPYGCQYHRAPTPLPEEWEGDLRKIAEKGYTHVQFRPQWRWHERIKGAYKWDDLDQLFELAGKNGLRVVLKPMLETAPDWVFKDFGGSRMGFHGVPLSPFAHGAYYVGGWWPCFDNPELVASASDFVRVLAGRYKDHPALWFYDAWNEPVSRPLGQCTCAHSTTSYRDWLKRCHGSIEKLNDTYGKAWTSFETIDPPTSGADYVEMFLWRKWAGYAVAEQVRFVAKALREIDPTAHILVHTGGSLIRQDPICSTSDDFQNRAAGVDRYGTSFWIPLHPETPTDHAAPELQSSWLRRIDPHYWCHEFYPNHANWCIPPEKGTLRRLIWSAIAGGAAGFTFWQYRSERVGCETNGYGLVHIDGAPTERSEVADSIASALKENAGHLASSKRVSSGVALLYSHDSDMISRIEKLPSGIESLEHERETRDYPYKKALSAAHTLYYFLGLNPEWVVPGDDMEDVKLLHIAGAEMIDGKTAEWLKAFVQKGGKLIVELPFASRDERTWVTLKIPSNGLEDLLGFREQDRVVATKEDRFSVGDFMLPAGDWRMALESCGTGQVLGQWTDGQTAVVRNDYGKGAAISLGGSLSLGFTNTWDDSAFNVLRKLVESLGLTVPDWAGSGLVVSKRVGEGEDYHFIFNYSDKTLPVHLPLERARMMDAQGATISNGTVSLESGGLWIGKSPRT
jgi:beta-galactosidase GanA